MIIGVPKERKEQEHRVGIVPAGVKVLTDNGHTVLIEHGAGQGSGISDDEYRAAGAELVANSHDIFSSADMILKVKEPTLEEADLMGEGQIFFGFLHLAAMPELTRRLLEKKVCALAYETIQLPDGSLPLLAPMSAIAGKLAIQAASYYLQKYCGGKGLLLGGVPGVRRGKATILGAGIVGMNALSAAVGTGAEVTLIDISLKRLSYAVDLYGGRISTLFSNPANLEASVMESDIIVGAVLIPGARAPRLVTKEMVLKMKPGSVIVDVSVDQGGCIETTRPTTFSNPTYTYGGVIHYAVVNMPGAVPQTSTMALTNLNIAYVQKIADLGLQKAIKEDPVLAAGLNLYKGEVTYKGVSEALGLPYVPLEKII